MTSKGDMVYASATDPHTREDGESGGAVTALLRFALERGMVDAVLGVEKGYDVYDAKPVLITDPAEVGQTSSSLHCGTLLLSKLFRNYLDGAKDIRIAASLKGCDVMGMYELAKRGYVDLDNVLMIGLNCGGSITPGMARSIVGDKMGLDPDAVEKEEISKGKFMVRSKTFEGSVSIDELENEGYGRRGNCRRCKMKVPRNADLACGQWGVTGEADTTFVEVCSRKGSELLDRAVDAGVIGVSEPDPKGIEIRGRIENSMLRLADSWREKDLKPLQMGRDRLQKMMEETSRCIKCYTCVDACPVLSGDKGPYLTVTPGEVPPRFEFHLVRYFHVADSCINCGQCEELCPMDIPNSLFMHAIAVDLEKIYGYHAGEDMSIPAVAIMKENGDKKGGGKR